MRQTGFLQKVQVCKKFEEIFSSMHNNIYSLSVSNAKMTALHLSLVALGIREGDEVIIPNVAFAACANAVILSRRKTCIM